MITLEKWEILTLLQKLPKNGGDLGKLIVAKGFKKFPKSNKLPNLVTLVVMICKKVVDKEKSTERLDHFKEAS